MDQVLEKISCHLIVVSDLSHLLIDLKLFADRFVLSLFKLTNLRINGLKLNGKVKLTTRFRFHHLLTSHT